MSSGSPVSAPPLKMATRAGKIERVVEAQEGFTLALFVLHAGLVASKFEPGRADTSTTDRRNVEDARTELGAALEDLMSPILRVVP